MGAWDTQGLPSWPASPLIENCPDGWQIPATQQWAPIPGTCHTDETVEGRKIGMGGGEDAKWTAPQTTAQTLDEELADPSRVQSYHKPCERALMGLTAGCLLSSWAVWLLSLCTAWLLNLWSALLLSLWTTWPLRLWTTWLLSLWTAWPLSLWTTWPLSSWWLT